MTGIICAMQIEADGIIALSQNTQTEEIAGMKFTTGTLNGKDIAVVVCGVGKVNAAMCAVVLIEKFNPDVVINSGAVSYTHLRAHETKANLVCRLLLEKKKKKR